VGLYLLRLSDSLDSLNEGEYYDPGYDYADSLYDRLVSDYEADSIAVFGQLEQVLGRVMRLTLGFRAERRATDYSDSSGLSAGPAETMTGGEAALSYDHSSSLTSYVALSSGYKAGGFNLGIVPAGRRDFAQERMWNVEAGIKSWLLDDRLQLNLSVFYNQRDDQQVRTSFQQVPGDPSSFVFYTDNAAEGESTGLEAELRWSPDDHWELYANLGLLDATFADFVTPEVDLTDRGQAHAPRYTYAAGGTWRSTSGWFLRADVSGKDDFYFDVSNNQKSKPYSIVNLRFGFESADWTTQLWVRNVFDEYYAVRGFYFGNEPPDFPPTLYTRAGDPRQVGISFDRRF
jgi:outer membrane receptor protein involved in Fe transport